MFGKPKILVEIIGEEGIKLKKKYPIEGNTIVIQPRKTRNPGYYPKFGRNCLLSYFVGFGPFKRLKQKLLLIEGANECVSFNFTGKTAEVDMPIWDRETEQKLFEASVIKAAGASVQRIKIPIFLYILVFMGFAIGFLNFLVATGRIRF